MIAPFDFANRNRAADRKSFTAIKRRTNLRELLPGGRFCLLDFAFSKIKRSESVEENESDSTSLVLAAGYAPLEQIQDLGTPPPERHLCDLGPLRRSIICSPELSLLMPDPRDGIHYISHPNPLKPAHEINTPSAERAFGNKKLSVAPCSKSNAALRKCERVSRSIASRL